jgi:hypothetical protein
LILSSLKRLGSFAGTFLAGSGTPIDTTGLSARDIKRVVAERRPLLVDIAFMRGAFFTRYGPETGGHFERACAAYLKTRRPEDVRAVLAAHYNAFSPRNLAEAFFGSSSPDLHPLNQLSPFDRFLPWIPEIRKIAGHDGQGNQSFGPVTPEKLGTETERLISVLNSLTRSGYHPEGFRQGLIRGYFLVRDHQFRFLITEGMHRAAALSAMKIGTIRVGIARKRPHIADAGDAANWPHVSSGFCSRNLALRIAGRYFE